MMTDRSCSLFVALALAGALAAQSLQPGYGSRVLPLPANATNVLHVEPDGVAWFDGTALSLQRGTAAPRLLLQTPPTFGGFLVAAGPAQLLFGDSGSGDLWLVPLRGAPPRLLANLPLPYDAAMLSADRVLVSARTGGFGANVSDLIAIELGSGIQHRLGSIAGASGPVAVDARGNVFYATASSSFPPPAGATAVLRWDRQLVQQAWRGQVQLSSANARTLASGIDSASSIAFDGDGDLLFVDWWRGSIGELSDLESGTPRRTDLLDYATAGVAAVTLQFAAGRGGSFEPYQPASGGALWVHESSFGVQSQLRTVTPRRPRLRSTTPAAIPAGPFDVLTDDGPPSGLGIAIIGPAIGLHEWSLQLPAFEQPLWFAPALLLPLAVRVVPFDAAGSMTSSFLNPGFDGRGVDCVVQVVVLDTAVPAIGSTPPMRLRLGR